MPKIADIKLRGLRGASVFRQKYGQKFFLDQDTCPVNILPHACVNTRAVKASDAWWMGPNFQGRQDEDCL